MHDGGTPAGPDRFELCRPTSGPFEWIARIGSSTDSPSLRERVSTAAVHADGDVIIGGALVGPVDFGSSTVPADERPSAYLARVGADGEVRWARPLGAVPEDLQVTSDDELRGRAGPLEAAIEAREVDLGGTTVPTGPDTQHAVTWDGDGTFVRELVIAVASDLEPAPDGGVWAVGTFSASLSIGTETLTPTPPESAPAGSFFDGWVARYAADGTVRWALGLGAGGFDAATAVAADAAGNVYVVGHVEDTVDFGGGPLTSARERDAFLLSLDADGGHRASRLFGGTGIDVASSVATDGELVFVGGTFGGTADLGTGPVESFGSSDVFVSAVDAAGDVPWAIAYGSEGNDSLSAVAVVGSRIAFAGGVEGTVDVAGTVVESADPPRSILVGVLDPAGEHVASGALDGDNSLDRAWSVAIAPDGSAYVAGDFRDTLVAPGCTLTARGGDGVLAKLRP